MHYCLTTAAISLSNITGSQRGTYANKAEQTLGRLLAEFDFASVEEIMTAGLHEYLDGTQRRVNLVGNAIQDIFFSPQPVAAAADTRTRE